MKEISVIIPVYDSESTLVELEQRLRAVLGPLGSYEIVLVNDGSHDGSYRICRALAEQHPEVKFIHLFRNFGQLNALLAGLRNADGRCCVIMDDDLQNPPEELPRLIAPLSEGRDFAFGVNVGDDGRGLFRALGSRFTRRVTNFLFDKPPHLTHSSFIAMTHALVSEIVRYDGPYPYIAGLIFRISQNGANVPVRIDARKAGTSGYSWRRLFKLWLNAFTTFSVVPLRIASLAGVVVASAGFLVLAAIVGIKLVRGYFVSGWVSLFGGTVFFAGVQLMTLGVIGEYVGRIFMVLSRSPQYAIKETFNCPAPHPPAPKAE